MLNLQLCVYGHGNSQVPCLFIFGDSLSDSGNNNNLRTDARVNYYPYGIDFPAGPTGRFTNGRTVIDIITQLLGFEKFIPPFRDTSGSDILQGVNYASGAAGIRNESGTHMGPDICWEQQLSNHKAIISKIAKKLGGNDKAQQHLNKCLYYVNIGSNDYINNYFMPEHYSSSRTYTPSQYAQVLRRQYSKQINALHKTGARKFALTGLSLVGCIPRQIELHGRKGSSKCVEEENEAVVIFNDNIKSLVDQFNNDLSLKNAKFIYINNALISSDNPLLPGMRSITAKCCEVGDNGQCVPDKKPCVHRNLHLFWDSFHPTEIANQILAKLAFRASFPSITHPMDISSLAKL
uniref:Uncharacterized protein n=1 Tax=Lotus japonicus TaxID=34305 RepID=I3T3P7_LOTJA|nr:unknown [Lotus japonicus]